MTQDLGRELRYVARSVGKSPWYFAMAAGLLGLSLGSSLAMFSLVDALLLKSLPVHGAERLVRIVTVRAPLGARSNFLYEEEFLPWRQRLSGFEDFFAWSEHDLGLEDNGAIERARVHFVTGEFFRALDAVAVVGRVTAEGDDQANVDGIAPVVLSYQYWQSRFGGDRAIAGKEFRIDGRKARVVGVTAKSFRGLSVESSPDVRVPVGWLRTLKPDLFENRIVCEVAGRVREGVAVESLRQEAESIWRNGWRGRNRSDPGLAGQFQFEAAGKGVSRMRSEYGNALWLVMGCMGLLMILVCVNVAGLGMARTAARREELAVRKALGASQAALLRGLLAEPLLILVAALGLAAALASAAIPRIHGMLPPLRDFTTQRLALALDLQMDWRVLGWGAAMACVALTLFGLLPAVSALRGDAHPYLAGGLRFSGSWSGRRWLAGLQIALCTLLLCGAGLSVESLRRLREQDLGFSAERVALFSISPRLAGYRGEDATKMRERLLAAVRALPEVEAAAAAGRGLMRGSGVKMTLAWAGERARAQDFLNSSGQSVTPGYFETMGIPLLEGRSLTERDAPEASVVAVVVNSELARRLSPGRRVVGRRFDFAVVNGKPAEAKYEVVGVVGDTKYRSLREPFQPIVHGPLAAEQDFILHVRTKGDAYRVAAAVQRALAVIDPRLPLVEVTTLGDEVRASMWAERVAAVLVSAFAVLAAVVSGAGLYAVMAFAVVQRRRELGIRAAVGARPVDVFRLLFGEGSATAAGGLFLGLVCALVAAPLVEGFLFGLEARAAGVYLAVSVVVAGLAGLAILAPAMRGARVDPAVALRRE